MVPLFFALALEFYSTEFTVYEHWQGLKALVMRQYKLLETNSPCAQNTSPGQAHCMHIHCLSTRSIVPLCMRV